MAKKIVILCLTVFCLTGCFKKDKKLVLATEAGFAPYEYYEDGKVVGVDIDIAKEIAKELGLELEIKDVAFDSIISEVKSGKSDIGAAGISYNKERAKEVDFTVDYSTSKQVVVVNEKSRINKLSDLDNIRNLKIAVQLGSVSDQYVTEHYPKAEITRQKKVLAAIQDLKTNKVNAVVIDELPAKEILKTNDGLRILDEILFEDHYGIIVQKGNNKLLKKVNKVLNRLIDEKKIESYIIKHTTK